MDNLVVPWFVRIWPVFSIIFGALLLYISILIIIFANLGVKVFKIYINKNRLN